MMLVMSMFVVYDVAKNLFRPHEWVDKNNKMSVCLFLCIFMWKFVLPHLLTERAG